MRLAPNPLRQKPKQIVFTHLELRPAQSTPENFVHQPRPIGRGNIDLAIRCHLRDQTLSHVTLDTPAIDVVRLSRKPERPAQVVEAGLCALIKAGQRVT